MIDLDARSLLWPCRRHRSSSSKDGALAPRAHPNWFVLLRVAICIAPPRLLIVVSRVIVALGSQADGAHALPASRSRLARSATVWLGGRRLLPRRRHRPLQLPAFFLAEQVSNMIEPLHLGHRLRSDLKRLAHGLQLVALRTKALLQPAILVDLALVRLLGLPRAKLEPVNAFAGRVELGPGSVVGRLARVQRRVHQAHYAPEPQGVKEPRAGREARCLAGCHQRSIKHDANDGQIKRVAKVRQRPPAEGEQHKAELEREQEQREAALVL
mmetsp:Transcript_17001/g.48528  ORF Transcript_17001/g.48528 Transcript_17001/m.48528 type:complete len:270 (-) Transcript_17001:442-1251(-)